MKKTPKIVGILNITPDSFSDGGLSGNNKEIIKTTRKLIEDGADIIDIGAESTRPGAHSLTHDEEWGRLEGVLQQICDISHKSGILTSIDTRHAKTAQCAIAAGIDWVNDVSGAGDNAMIDILANWQGRVVIMHNLGVPADKKITISEKLNPVEEVKKWLLSRIEFLEEKGISRDRVIIDPGVGFGKTAEQSWELLENIVEFMNLGAEVFVGHSRKSFISNSPQPKYPSEVERKILSYGGAIEERDAATLEISKRLVSQGVHYLRVHNVALHNKLKKIY
jgi:dihydropteroate synthase